MQRPPLIFNIATNGFAQKYSECLATHLAWARRQGYALAQVRRPVRVQEPALAAWLKISLLREYLQLGFDDIAYIDADCRISADTPDFVSELRANSTEPVRMARGRSNRVNSGVIMVHSTPESKAFIGAVIDSAEQSIPEQVRSGLKYENGNVEFIASSMPVVGDIDIRWNNTFKPELDDYIRHYTGPLRSELSVPRHRSLVASVIRRSVRAPTSAPESRDRGFLNRLENLTVRAMRTNTIQLPVLGGANGN